MNGGARPCLLTSLLMRVQETKDLYETAQFEEKHFNKPYATELYRHIVERYRNSPYASQASFGRAGEALIRKA